MNSKVKNISINYIFLFFAYMRPTVSIWVLFLTQRGLSLLEIGLLESIFHISGFLFEVPTGALADIFGRKNIRVLGRISAVISTILMIFANDFYLYAVSFVLSALSYNLESGTGDALLYESCKEAGMSHKYDEILGKAYIFLTVGDSIGSLIGGFLVSKNLFMPYYMSLSIEILSLAVSLFFNEVKTKEEKKINQKVIEGIKFIFNDRSLILFFIAISLFSASVVSIRFYNQKFFLTTGVPVTFFGIIFFVQGLFDSFGGYVSEKIEKAFKDALMPAILIISAIDVYTLSISKGYTSIIFAFLLQVLSGIAETYAIRIINRRTPDTVRATVISAQSLLFSLFMMFVFPFVGYVADKYGFTVAYTIISMLLFVGLLTAIKIKNVKE